MPIRCNPGSVEEWLEVSQARICDAKALCSSGLCDSAVYMAGYAVESAMKAHCVRLGKSPKSGGGSGHNLRELWKTLGYESRDLGKEDVDECVFFLGEWSTDLRYCSEYEFPQKPEQLVENGAGKLVELIKRRIKRVRKGRN